MSNSEFEKTSIDPSGGDIVHSGGKVGEAGADLADGNSSSTEKSTAGEELKEHQEDYHPK